MGKGERDNSAEQGAANGPPTASDSAVAGRGKGARSPARKHDYASALRVFARRAAQLDQSSALIVLDTNALLVPYRVGKQSLEDIKSALAEYKAQGRLVVPAEVALEYARNRPEEIKKAYDAIEKAIARSHQQFEPHMFIRALALWKEIERSQQKINEEWKNITRSLAKIRDEMHEWSWRDPVRDIYSELFDHSVVCGLSLSETDIQDIIKSRFSNRQPPGFQDSGKDDGGGGDVRIWLTILELVTQRPSDVLFVSSDEKNDWHHKSNGKALFPHTELLEEFDEKSNGKTFKIIPLSDLLERRGVSLASVNEVRKAETISTTTPTAPTEAPWLNSVNRTSNLVTSLRLRDAILRGFLGPPEELNWLATFEPRRRHVAPFAQMYPSPTVSVPTLAEFDEEPPNADYEPTDGDLVDEPDHELPDSDEPEAPHYEPPKHD